MRMPAETAPHERTVMCWPMRAGLYGDLLPDAERAHAEVASTIARFEPVTMIASAPVAERAATRCGPAVEVVELPTDDSWFRDTGPIYVLSADGSRRVALDWIFNSWGEKYAPWERDAALAAAWAAQAGDELRAVPRVLEGGSIAVDGDGTLVTTTQCLMHPNRNPSLTQSQIEECLRVELGVDVILWLPYGLALDDDTDGHVDNVAAFARPGVLVMQGCADEVESDHLRLSVDRRCASGAADAAGRAIEVVEVPVLPFADVAGRRVAVPYLNYYVGNGFVVVPVCGHDADADMVAVIAEQYPGRDAIPLDVGATLAYGGGGIHCITQQVPAISLPVTGGG
ncbi:agmatine deiminase family protein [soil metagenome]